MRKVLTVLAVLLVVVIGGAAAFVATFDPNSYKGWIESAASDALNKTVRFNGPIELTRSLTPRVVVNDLVVEDDDEQLISIDRAEASVVLPALIRGQVHIPRVAIADVVAKLPLDLPATEADVDGEDDASGEPVSIPRVDDVELTNIRLAYQPDAGEVVELDLERGTLRSGTGQTKVDMAGRVGGQPFTVDGTFGAIEDLFLGRPDLPARLSAELGPADLDVKGSLSLQPGGRGVRYDLAVAMRATALGDLLHSLGAPPLALQAAALDVQLVGDEARLQAHPTTIVLDDSEIQADLAVQWFGPRPEITGDIRAETLDLTPFVPAQDPAAEPDQARDEAAGPVTPLDVALPGPDIVPLDLDLQVAIARLVLPGGQFDQIQVDVDADQGGIDAVLHPLSFAGATVGARLAADASQDPAPLSARFQATQLNVGAALDIAKIDLPLSGMMDLELDLTGRGRTLRDLMSTLTGGVDASGRLAYQIEPDRPLVVSLDQAAISLQPDAATAVEVAGSADDIRFRMSGATSGLEALVVEGGDLPVDFELWVADASVRSSGTLAFGGEVEQLDYAFDLTVDIPTPAKLAAAAGVELPALPSSGLSAHIRRGDDAVLIERLAATAGRSELSGGLTLGYGGARPALAGAIRAPLIDLGEFLPAEDGKPEPEAETAPGGGRAIPAVDLPVPSLIPIDLDLAAEVDRLDGLPEPIEDIQAKVGSDAQTLTFKLDNAILMQGAITFEYSADASTDPPGIRLRTTVDHLDLGETLASEAIRGELFVTAELDGRGADLRTFLAGAQGRIEETSEDLFVANKYVDLAGRSILTALLPSWEEEPGLEIYCTAIYIDVGDGKATTAGFVIDSQRMTIGGGGGVDLLTERIDFLVLPEAKRQTIANLVAPVHVEGTLAEPEVTPDAADFIFETTKSVAFSFLLPVKLAIPIVTGGDEQGREACVEAVNRPGKEPKSVFAKTGETIGGAAATVGGAAKSVGEGAAGVVKKLFGQ